MGATVKENKNTLTGYICMAVIARPWHSLRMSGSVSPLLPRRADESEWRMRSKEVRYTHGLGMGPSVVPDIKGPRLRQQCLRSWIHCPCRPKSFLNIAVPQFCFGLRNLKSCSFYKLIMDWLLGFVISSVFSTTVRGLCLVPGQFYDIHSNSPICVDPSSLGWKKKYHRGFRILIPSFYPTVQTAVGYTVQWPLDTSYLFDFNVAICCNVDSHPSPFALVQPW